MQEVTPWPESFDVTQPVALARVDGTEFEVDSVSVYAELDSAMPERVAAAGGVVAATGDATLVKSSAVSEAGFNPWGDAQRIVEAAEVTVEAGFQGQDGQAALVRQITGQVQKLSGGASSSSVGLDFIDHTVQLDRGITIEPLLEIYPPLEAGGAYRFAGLSTLYVTDRVLRHCGFYATPPMVNGAVVSAPLMGSTVPERGVLTGVGALSDPDRAVVFRGAPWGIGPVDGLITYAPDFGARGHGRVATNVTLSFLRASRDGVGSSSIEALWGSGGDSIRVTIGSTIAVRYRSGGTSTLVATLPASDTSASEVFSVIVNVNGQVTIRASNGATVTGTASLPGAVTSQDLRQMQVIASPGAPQVGGVQVGFGADSVHDFERTAHIGRPGFYTTITSFPSQTQVNCLALLKEQSEAELSAMWVDEYGHFHWVSRTQLRTGTPVGTLTCTKDLFDLQWELPVGSVYSRVELSYDDPRVVRRASASITVSSSKGSTLTNGENENRFFEPPADEDWHQVEPPVGMTFIPEGGSYHLRRGRGSYQGGVVVSEGEEEDVTEAALSQHLTQSWEQISPQKWLLSSSVQGLEETQYVEQRLMDWRRFGSYAEENLPIIRAKALTQWSTETIRGSSRGPALAPVLTHDVGPWVQNQYELQELLDFLDEHLTEPDVILRRVPIVPDPRIQLGDIFWLQDTSAYHVRLRVVVMGKTLTYQATGDGYEMTQELDVRILSMQHLKRSYEDLSVVWESRDYEDLQAAWVGQSYTGLENSPLDRS